MSTWAEKQRALDIEGVPVLTPGSRKWDKQHLSWNSVIESVLASATQEQRERQHKTQEKRELRLGDASTRRRVIPATDIESTATERTEALQLCGAFDYFVQQLEAQRVGKLNLAEQSSLDKMLRVIREEQAVFDLFFHEAIRQASEVCRPRGKLLERIRAQYASMFARIPQHCLAIASESIRLKKLCAAQQDDVTELRGTAFQTGIELSEYKKRHKNLSYENEMLTSKVMALKTIGDRSDVMHESFREEWAKQREALLTEVSALREEKEQYRVMLEVVRKAMVSTKEPNPLVYSLLDKERRQHDEFDARDAALAKASMRKDIMAELELERLIPEVERDAKTIEITGIEQTRGQVAVIDPYVQSTKLQSQPQQEVSMRRQQETWQSLSKENSSSSTQERSSPNMLSRTVREAEANMPHTQHHPSQPSLVHPEANNNKVAASPAEEVPPSHLLRMRVSKAMHAPEESQHAQAGAPETPEDTQVPSDPFLTREEEEEMETLLVIPTPSPAEPRRLSLHSAGPLGMWGEDKKDSAPLMPPAVRREISGGSVKLESDLETDGDGSFSSTPEIERFNIIPANRESEIVVLPMHSSVAKQIQTSVMPGERDPNESTSDLDLSALASMTDAALQESGVPEVVLGAAHSPTAISLTLPAKFYKKHTEKVKEAKEALEREREAEEQEEKKVAKKKLHDDSIPDSLLDQLGATQTQRPMYDENFASAGSARPLAVLPGDGVVVPPPSSGMPLSHPPLAADQMSQRLTRLQDSLQTAAHSTAATQQMMRQLPAGDTTRGTTISTQTDTSAMIDAAEMELARARKHLRKTQLKHEREQHAHRQKEKENLQSLRLPSVEVPVVGSPRGWHDADNSPAYGQYRSLDASASAAPVVDALGISVRVQSGGFYDQSKPLQSTRKANSLGERKSESSAPAGGLDFTRAAGGLRSLMFSSKILLLLGDSAAAQLKTAAHTFTVAQGPLPWLGKCIRDAYQAKKQADETNHAENVPLVPFPEFIYRRMRQKYGIRKMLVQKSVDFILAVDHFREEHPEVELFAQFLEESRQLDELTLFLRALAVVQGNNTGLYYQRPLARKGTIDMSEYICLHRAARSLDTIFPEQQQVVAEVMGDVTPNARLWSDPKLQLPESVVASAQGIKSAHEQCVSVAVFLDVVLGKFRAMEIVLRHQSIAKELYMSVPTDQEGRIEFIGFEQIFSMAQPAYSKREIALLYANTLRSAGIRKLDMPHFAELAHKLMQGGVVFVAKATALDNSSIHGIGVLVTSWNQLKPFLQHFLLELEHSNNQADGECASTLKSLSYMVDAELSKLSTSSLNPMRLFSLYRGLIQVVLSHQSAWLMVNVHTPKQFLQAELSLLLKIVHERQNLINQVSTVGFNAFTSQFSADDASTVTGSASTLFAVTAADTAKAASALSNSLPTVKSARHRKALDIQELHNTKRPSRPTGERPLVILRPSSHEQSRAVKSKSKIDLSSTIGPRGSSSRAMKNSFVHSLPGLSTPRHKRGKGQ